MHVVCFSLYNQCFKLYHKVHYMLLSLLEHFDLLFSICYLTLITKHYLDFFNKIILILDIVFFFYLINLLLCINSYYIPSKLGQYYNNFSSVAMILLLLRNNQISLYQSSNFIQLLLNYFRSGTILFCITVYAVLLYTAGIGAVNISSDDTGFVILFLSEAYSSVILNDLNISSSVLMFVVLQL